MRRTSGFKNRPVSSIRTRWAPVSLAFLNARPVVGDPVDDDVVVALAGLPSGPLGRIAAFGEPTPHRGRVERDTEIAADQFDDPAGAPEVGAKAVGRRLLGQPRFYRRLLRGTQKSGPSRRGFGGQARFPLRPMPGHPLGHRHGVNAETLGYRSLGPTGQHPRDRLSPKRFQCGSRSDASHTRRKSRNVRKNQ